MKKIILMIAFVCAAVMFAGSPASAVVDDDGTEHIDGTDGIHSPLDNDGDPISGNYPVQVPGNPRPSDCQYSWSTDFSFGHSWGPLGIDIVDVGTEVYYRNCTATGTNVRHVTPLRFDIVCRSRGPGDPQNVVHNMYFSDFDGNSYNPHPKTMNCDSRDWQQERYGISDPKPRFHKCAAGAPRWKDDIKIAVPGQSDLHATTGSAYWGFTGPTVINC